MSGIGKRERGTSMRREWEGKRNERDEGEEGGRQVGSSMREEWACDERRQDKKQMCAFYYSVKNERERETEKNINETDPDCHATAAVLRCSRRWNIDEERSLGENVDWRWQVNGRWQPNLVDRLVFTRDVWHAPRYSFSSLLIVHWYSQALSSFHWSRARHMFGALLIADKESDTNVCSNMTSTDTVGNEKVRERERERDRDDEGASARAAYTPRKNDREKEKKIRV